MLWLPFGFLQAAEIQPPPQFERDVLPIFTAHCLRCHGLEARAAGLDLRTPPLVFRGSDKGPVVVKGSSKQSPLFRKIAEGAMPPKGELPLRSEQIGVVARWLDAGAPFARSYGTLTKAEAPEVTGKDRAHWAFRKAVPARFTSREAT
jgi:mono/diheme cytochrome c family protein